jgi:uncharacterized protein (DUF697 family)
MTPRQLILAHAALAAGVGAGLAPVPGADLIVLGALQARLIQCLAEELGAPLSRARAAELVLTLGAGMGGRGLARALVARAPGAGQAIQAATAAAMTVAVGEAALRWLSEDRPAADGWAR